MVKSISRGFTKKANSQGESLARIYLAKQEKVGRDRKGNMQETG
jgi:hypothetical protein